MEVANQPEEQQIALDNPAIEGGATFLHALFAESDTILFRPIETWAEAGKKRSRVVYKSVLYRAAKPVPIRLAHHFLLQVSEAERANVFFGVCPRLGDRGRFDLAWQIRLVRTLWTDIDHVSVDEALERIAKAGLPLPSITDPILSFRLLGYSQEIRAENSHIFCITANTPDVSRDLVTRSVVVNLYHEGNPERRTFSIADPEGHAQQHRRGLLGDLIGMVERWKAAGMPTASVHSRFNKRGWGAIVGGILSVCGEPGFLDNAEEAAVQLDKTRREFAELVAVLADHAQGTWAASELAGLSRRHGLLTTDLGEGSPRSLATKMGTVAGRFVSERFPLADGRQAVFHREGHRKGNIYRVGILDAVPNLESLAEPLPNLGTQAGSAP